jgi:hypothetical protein
MDPDQPLIYQIYVITCWQEREDRTEGGSWVFILEASRSGERRRFTTLEEVKIAIETELTQKDQ